MGSGSWDSSRFTSYTASKGLSYCTNASTGKVVLSNTYTAQDIFKSRRLNEALNPHKVLRECVDSEEHPCTIPVILALDVTGSMGKASAEVAKKLNEIMEQLFEKIKDVEFMTMAIGDLAYDEAPIQASQFESDIRIAEQLDKVYFEAGGGGNTYESYTAAWYFGLNNTKLDCWNRGKKGIIITMGDEPLNPYLPSNKLNEALGCNTQGNVETPDLYKSVTEKFDVYHLIIVDPETSAEYYGDKLDKTWGEYLDEGHLKRVGINDISKTVTEIVEKLATDAGSSAVKLNESGEISW